MKKLSATRRRFHGRRDALQAQALQHGTFSDRSQKTAGGNIDHAIDKRRLVIVWTANWEIAVGQAAWAHERGLLPRAPRGGGPRAAFSAQGRRSQLAPTSQPDEPVW